MHGHLVELFVQATLDLLKNNLEEAKRTVQNTNADTGATPDASRGQMSSDFWLQGAPLYTDFSRVSQTIETFSPTKSQEPLNTDELARRLFALLDGPGPVSSRGKGETPKKPYI